MLKGLTMPDMETDDLHQKAVHWAANGYDDYGKFKVDAAAEIDTRWEIKQGEFINALGETVAYDSIAWVSSALTVGSILWLGALSDIATPPVNLRQIVARSIIPDVKNRATRYKMMLVKHSDTLPTLA